jgi:predicted RNA binding protein YcfA (HicA-like mRNA interferase family)
VKLPRDLSGRELAAALQRFGYRVDRQTGSHIRLVTEQGGGHRITVPEHSPLKVGTLSAILRDVARHASLTRSELVRRLFA